MKSQIPNPKSQIQILIALLISLLFAMNLCGCAELQKKFIRKKKTVKAEPHYYRIQDYKVKPSIELYTQHYVYWRSWNREIVEMLGINSKKDKRCISEMIGNLEDMASMLIDEKAQELDKHIQVIRGIENDIQRGNMSFATKSRIKKVLEKEFALIKINFSYRKMGPFIRPEFKRMQSEKS
jgi:Ni,Fe-hydrogenase I large subunit